MHWEIRSCFIEYLNYFQERKCYDCLYKTHGNVLLWVCEPYLVVVESIGRVKFKCGRHRHITGRIVEKTTPSYQRWRGSYKHILTNYSQNLKLARIKNCENTLIVGEIITFWFGPQFLLLVKVYKYNLSDLNSTVEFVYT